MPHNEPATSIVPRTVHPLSWAGVTGREAIEVAPAPEPVKIKAVVATPIGELRQLTRAEGVAERYGFDHHDRYQEAAAMQIATLEHGQEVWERVKRERIERGEITDKASFQHAVEADFHNVGNLIGSLLFGD